MYINGKAKIGTKNGEKYEITVLMADIFDTNNCFKAMLMCRFDDEIKLLMEKDIEVEINQVINVADYFECINLDFGKQFKIEMFDFYAEADFLAGDIFRMFISNEDESDTKISLINGA